MTAAVEIILTLEPFTGPGSELWVGQGLRATMAVKDVATGAGVAATGVRMLVRQGGAAVPTEYEVGELTTAGVGRWVLDLVPDAGGPLWVRAECMGPRPGAREARARVRASNVLEDEPPDVIMATPEGEAIGTPDGAAVTARRMDRLAGLGAPEAGDKLLGVRGDEAGTVTWSALKAAAEDAGEEAARMALGNQVVPLPITGDTALTAAQHGRKWLLLTGSGGALSAAWADTGIGFSTVIVNDTSYHVTPVLTGFTTAEIQGGAVLGVKPGGTAQFYCVEWPDGRRLGYLIGQVA